MAGNQISGRVVLKETGVGIPDLLVVIHDLDPGSPPEEAVNAPPVFDTHPVAPDLGLGDRLGSRLTDRFGAFVFLFEDAEYRVRNEQEKRPDLRLAVLAPEEPGLPAEARVLYVSGEIRQDAGRIEQYLIRLPEAALLAAGLSAPPDPAVAREEVRTVVGKLARATAYHAELETETRKVAKARVNAVRDQARIIEDAVEKRIVSHLTGQADGNASAPAGGAVAAPDEPVENAVWRTVKTRIETVINPAGPVIGYMVLDAADAEMFKQNGEWMTDAPADRVEPFLYRADSDGGRATSLSRADPAIVACRAAAVAGDKPIPPASPPTQATTSPNPSPDPGGPFASIDQTVNASDLPRFVGRLIGEMASPDWRSADGPGGRPTVDEVQASVSGLRLQAGAADAVAFHDYHNLQIAFDYVWRQLLNQDVVEVGVALAHSLEAQGGDPLAALAAGGDPIKALRREGQYVARSKPLNANGLMGPGEAGLYDPAVPPHVDPPPPLPTPPTNPNPVWNGGLTAGIATDPREPHELLDILNSLINERYKFEVFAPGSTNFGLLVTYRQRWEPLNYQAGDLVYTQTLAPKETRRIASKRTVRRERSVKETEANLRNRSDESKDTMRIDAEVVQRAMDKTNFNVNAKGSYNIGIAKGDSTTTLDKSAEASSQETKKSFHESVMSAAMQLRSERGWSFETKDSFEDEASDSSEITNPNDELTVTYLFYELERRFRVTEHINRLTPVVMVAMEVPPPDRRSIDKILLGHSWIINRVLLDDRYRVALDYLCTKIAGDEIALRESAKVVATINAAVEQLKTSHKNLEQLMIARELSLTRAIESRAAAVASENTEGWGEKAWEAVTGSGDEEDLESARILEDMRREAYERSIREEKDLRMRLDSEVAALTAAQQAYAKAYGEHVNRLVEVNSLRAHFKENVLYYMQAIWSFTFEDQIFFQLASVKAPRLTAREKTYAVQPAQDPPLSLAVQPGRVVLQVTAGLQLESDITVENDAVTLAEIADLDSPLGFKGNYMLFPLRQSNPLTDFMMVPYVDAELGLHDPDDLASWAPEDFAEYARCVLKAQAETLSEPALAALEKELGDQYRKIVSSPRRLSDDIVVPSDSLFIEALPGAHPLLEDFKLRHRIMDVEKAREETRRMKLESLRYAARILDGALEDPDVDRRIVIDGATPAVIAPTDTP